MGMSIDETMEYLMDFSLYSPYQEAIEKVSAYIEQMQSEYEARLKADMVAMLTDIQMEIDELWEITWKSDYRGGYKDGCVKANNIIQEKINALKEGEDDV